MNKTLKPGTIKRIHVNRQVLAANVKHGRSDPAWTIQTSKGPVRCQTFDIRGKAYSRAAGDQTNDGRIVKQLSCGARMWIETKAEVTAFGIKQ